MHAEERQFLHDLSNPLAICLGNLKIMLEKLKTDPGSVQLDQLLDKLTKATDGVDQARKMLSARRKELVRRDEEAEKKQEAG